jgi:hypothetical protein
VRQATIPHGDSLVAQSTSFKKVSSGPTINPVDSFPFPLADPIPDLNDVTHAVDTNETYLAPYKTDPLPDDCLPKGLNAAETIRDPTMVLKAQIKGQTIIETSVIQITTSFPSPLPNSPAVQGIVNIPFVVKNANATQMDAIFWIEKVQHPKFHDRNFLQLQYVQRVILDFHGLHWPHVSVATLIKAA